MSSKPLISVLMPAFNADETIGFTLESVLRQSYRPIEVIIVNDGSTDSTSAVIEAWRRDNHASGFEVVIESQANMGLLISRERGLRLSRGKYLQFLDADDVLHFEKFSSCVPSLETGEWDVVVPRTQKFRCDDEIRTDLTAPPAYRPWRCRELARSSITTNYWHSVGPLFSREVVERSGAFSAGVHPYAEELDFHGRVKLATNRVRYLDAVLSFYRKGNPAALTGTLEKVYRGRIEGARVAFALLREFEITDRREWSSLTEMCLRTYYQCCVMTDDRQLQQMAKASFLEVLRHRSYFLSKMCAWSMPCAPAAMKAAHRLRRWIHRSNVADCSAWLKLYS